MGDLLTVRRPSVALVVGACVGVIGPLALLIVRAANMMRDGADGIAVILIVVSIFMVGFAGLLVWTRFYFADARKLMSDSVTSWPGRPWFISSTEKRVIKSLAPYLVDGRSSESLPKQVAVVVEGGALRVLGPGAHLVATIPLGVVSGYESVTTAVWSQNLESLRVIAADAVLFAPYHPRRWMFGALNAAEVATLAEALRHMTLAPRKGRPG